MDYGYGISRKNKWESIMKNIKLNNAIEIAGIDLNNDDDAEALGHTVASQCVVLVKDSVAEPRLQQICKLWGQPSTEIVTNYILEKRLTGRHWRNHILNLRYITKPFQNRFKDNLDYARANSDNTHGMTRVSFDKDKKTNRPLGLFTSGKLDWHSDQFAFWESQRVIALMSLYGTKNSQTTFLCTADAYSKLNHEDKTMVDELVCVYEWDGGTMCDDLDKNQMDLVKYNQLPLDGMESPLKDQTASGVEGIKFPCHSFSKFKGMGTSESYKFRKYLWSKLDKPEYVYRHHWEDGQIMFMDQSITLHARPTDVQAGNKRTLVRMVTYMDKLYPETGKPRDTILWNNKNIPHEEFAKLVDQKKLQDHNETI